MSRMLRLTIGTLLLSLVLCIFPQKVFAAFSFSVTQVTPGTVASKEEDVQVTINVVDLPDGDSYFRLGLDAGSAYIGYVKNNLGNWVKLDTLTNDKNNLQCNNYFKVSTSGTYVLDYKIGADNDLANNTYFFKAHRFTSTCGSYTPSSESPNLSLMVNLPTPIPSPTPSPTPISSPTPSPTSTASPTPTTTPTKTPTPTPSPTKTPTPAASANPNKTPDGLVLTANTNSEVSDLRAQLVETPTPVAVEAGKGAPYFPFGPVIFIGGGIFCLGCAGYLLLKSKNRYTESYNEPDQET